MTHDQLLCGSRFANPEPVACCGPVVMRQRYNLVCGIQDAWFCELCGDVLLTDKGLEVVAVHSHTREKVGT